MPYHRPITDVFDLQFEPTYAAAAQARHEARQVLDAWGLPPGAAADLELVLGELASNAVEQGPDLPVRVQVVVADGSIHLTVANQAMGAPPADLAATPDGGADHDLLADRGRGLRIVRALTDELLIDSDGGWTSVRCTVRFDRSGG